MSSPVKQGPHSLFFGVGLVILFYSACLLVLFWSGETAFLTSWSLSDPYGTAGQWFGTTVLFIFVAFSALGLYWFWRDVIQHRKAFEKAHALWEKAKAKFQSDQLAPNADALIKELTEEVKSGSRLTRAVLSWNDPSPNSDAEMLIEGEADRCRQQLNLLQAVASILVLIGLVGNFFGLSEAVRVLPDLMPTQKISERAKPDVSSTTVRTSNNGWEQTIRSEDPVQKKASTTAQDTVQRISNGLSVVVVSSVFGIGGMIFMLFFVAVFRSQFNHLVGEEVLLLAVEIGSAVRPGHATGESLMKETLEGLNTHLANDQKHKDSLKETLDLLNTRLGGMEEQKNDVKTLSGQLERVLQGHLDKEDTKFGKFSESLDGLRNFLEARNEALSNFLNTATQTGEKMDSMAGNLKKVADSLVNMVDTQNNSVANLSAYAEVVKTVAEEDRSNSEKRHAQLVDKLSEKLTENLTELLEKTQETAEDLQLKGGNLLAKFTSFTTEQRSNWDSLDEALSLRFDQKLQAMIEEARLGETRTKAIVNEVKEQFGTVNAEQRLKLEELIRLQNQNQADFKNTLTQLQEDSSSKSALLATNLKSVTDASTSSFDTLLERVASLTAEQRTKWDSLENALSERFAQKLQGWLDEAKLNRDSTDQLARDLIKDGDSRNHVLADKLIEQFASVSVAQQRKFEELMQLQGQLQEQTASQNSLLASSLKNVADESASSLSATSSGLLEGFGSLAEDQRTRWDNLENILSDRFAQKLQIWLDEAKQNRDSTDQLAQDLIKDGDSRNQILVDKLIEQFASVSAAQQKKFEELMQLQSQLQERLETAHELSQKDTAKTFHELQEQAAAQGALLETSLKQVFDESSSSFSHLTAKLEAQLAGVTEAFQMGFAPLQHWLEDVAKSSQDQQGLLAEQAKDIMAGLQSATLSHEQQAQTCRDILVAGQQALDSTRVKILELQDHWHVSLEGVAQELSSRWHDQQAHETSKLETVLTDHSGRIVAALDALQAREAAVQAPLVDFSRLESLLAEQTQLLTVALERGQFHQGESTSVPGTADWTALENLLAGHSQRVVTAVENSMETRVGLTTDAPTPGLDKEALRAVMSEQAEKIVTAFQTLMAATPPTTNGAIDYARLELTLGEQAQRIIAALDSKALQSPSSSSLIASPELSPALGQLTQLAKKTNESLENLQRTLSEGYRSPCLNCGLSNSGRAEYCVGCGVSLKQEKKPPVAEPEPLAPMFASLLQAIQRVEGLLSRQNAAVAPVADPGLLSALEQLTSRVEATGAPPAMDPVLLSALDQRLHDLTEALQNFEISMPAPATSVDSSALIDQVGRLTAVLEAYLEESKAKKKGWFG